MKPAQKEEVATDDKSLVSGDLSTDAAASKPTWQELKAQYPDQVAECSTFKPQGVAEREADPFWTAIPARAEEYFDQVKQGASPGTTDDAVYEFAQQQIQSGSELPTQVQAIEPLFHDAFIIGHSFTNTTLELELEDVQTECATTNATVRFQGVRQLLREGHL